MAELYEQPLHEEGNNFDRVLPAHHAIEPVGPATTAYTTDICQSQQMVLTQVFSALT